MANRKTKNARRKNVAHLAMKQEKKLAVLPVQTENSRYWMTPGELAQVHVFRASDGGFQRALSERRVADIVAELEVLKSKERKSNFPELELANVNGKIYNIDGQHRMEGHIRAGMDCPVHVSHMSLGEAHDLFVRNNSKAKSLRKTEIMVATRDKIGLQLRAWCKAYKCTMSQAVALSTGVNNGRPIAYAGDGMDDRQERVGAVILEIWTNDPRFIPIDPSDNTGVDSSTKARAKLRKSIEWAFSTTSTLYALGRLGYDALNNINKLKRDIRTIQEGDWNLARLNNSMRALARNGAKKKDLYEFMKSNVLLPAYRGEE